MNINVDQEISFKIRQNRDSSSLEERIDTSDEMMEIEQNLCDSHSRFIAECEAQAKNARGDQWQPTLSQQIDEGE